MSVTIDSTNPRIIADNIRKLDDAVQYAASELPEVETTDAGKVLTVNALGKWDASDLPPYPVGNLDYSETEQNTGVKWIDGKEIYRIVFSGTTSNTTTGQETIGSISFDSIINFTFYYNDESSIRYSNVLYVTLAGSVVIGKSASIASKDYISIIYYTKPSATLNMNASPDRELNEAPETDAAPEPEAEPELKKVTKKKTTTKKEEEE